MQLYLPSVYYIDVGAKILLIEDEPFVSDLYSHELKTAGYDVKIITDGTAGLKAMDEETFDLVLLDIMLPGMNGLDILRTWRSKHKDSKLPVILLTNLGQDNVISEGFRIGAQGYMIKANYKPNKVLEEVQRILSESK